MTEFHEASNQRLWTRLPADQLERVFNSDCDIDETFLGFVGIYERLADIIPREWSVVDLGCAYAPQAFFFDRHREYIGVDFPGGERFAAANTKHYGMSIRDFIEAEAARFDQRVTFAICSYVPPWADDNMRLARDAFMNVFTYYPGGVSSSVLALLARDASLSTA